MNRKISGTRGSLNTSGRSPLLPGLLALLGSRLILFLLFQSMIALIFNSWTRSEGYWLLTATLTNMVSIAILWLLFRNEGTDYLSLFRFNHATLRKDIVTFILLALLIGPVAFAPNYLLSTWLWTDPTIPYSMMFRPVEKWLSIVLLFAFPFTIVFAELATYFGYIMPRLQKELNSSGLTVGLPVLLLSLQHMTMPFIPDLKFIIYRGLVFLPFAALIGIALHRRPTLFPYFALLHGIMDMGTAVMFLMPLM